MKIDPEKLQAAITSSGLEKRQVIEAAGWSSIRRLDQVLNGKGININLNIVKAIARRLRVKTSDIAMEASDETN